MSELVTNGITENTPKTVMLGAGTVHKGLTYTLQDGWNFRESLWFATSGGNKLTIKPSITDLEPDGAWVPVKGMQVKIGEEASVECTPMEITHELLKAAGMMEEGDSDATGYSMLKSNEFLTNDAYIENFGWVGQTAEGKAIIVLFPLAYCPDGLELDGKSKEKSVPTVKISCIQEAGANAHILPYRIYTEDE